MPFANWSGPNFRWRVVSAANYGGEFSIPGEREILKVPESMKALRSLPNCAHGIVTQIQFRDCAAATDVLGDQNAIRREPEKRTHRCFATRRAIRGLAAIRRYRKEIAAMKSFIAHQSFNEGNRFSVRRPARDRELKRRFVN